MSQTYEALTSYLEDLRNSLRLTLEAIPHLRDSLVSSRESEGAVRRLGEAAMLIRTEIAAVMISLQDEFVAHD